MLNFVIANIGQGPAHKVSYVLEGDEEDLILHKVRLQNNKRRTAINILPQGEKVVSFFWDGT